tara:strand:- start:118 stop:396 length:279 start_codon:yes stop_codon:yes gene_type:complete
MELNNNIIRKITIARGDIKDGISYVVGRIIMGGTLKIEAIMRDEAYYQEYGEVCYSIYCSKVGSPGEAFAWKDFFGQPMIIEYDINPDYDAL